MAGDVGGVDILAIIGTLSAIAGTGVAVLGSVIARERYILRTTQERVDAVLVKVDDRLGVSTSKLDAEITSLHGRISTIRDSYVRRDDLEMHLRKIEETTKSLRTDVKDLAEGMRAELKEHRRESAAQNKELIALVIEALKTQS